MVKFIFGNLPKLLIYICDEKYIENILEFVLKLAWNWKLKVGKRIGKCKNLKSYFRKTYPKLIHLCLNQKVYYKSYLYLIRFIFEIVLN